MEVHDTSAFLETLARSLEQKPFPTHAISVTKDVARRHWKINHSLVQDEDIVQSWQSCGHSEAGLSYLTSTPDLSQGHYGNNRPSPGPSLYLLIIDDKSDGCENTDAQSSRSKKLARQQVLDHCNLTDDHFVPLAYLRKLLPRYNTGHHYMPPKNEFQYHGFTNMYYNLIFAYSNNGSIRILVCGLEKTPRGISDLLGYLRSVFYHKHICGNPLTLYTLAISGAMSEGASWSLDLGTDLTSNCNKSQKSLEGTPKGIFGMRKEEELMAGLTNKATSISHDASRLEKHFDQFNTAAQHIRDESVWLQRSKTSEMTTEEWELALGFVKDNTDLIMRDSAYWITHCRALRQRAKTQLLALSNLAGARNQTVRQVDERRVSRADTLNIITAYRSAMAPGKSNASVEAIAIIMMIFMPGTFLACLFTMPVFNWTARGDGGIVNSRIWIFFVSMATLTLLTMLLVFLWIWIMRRSRSTPPRPIYPVYEKDDVESTRT